MVLTDPRARRDRRVASRKRRPAFQPKVLTYTLSLLVNKCATIVVLGAGLIMTGHAVLTPMLQALAMLGGDFVTMSRAADRVQPSPHPNTWRIRNLNLAAIPLGLFKLCYCVGVLATGWFGFGLGTGQMQTLTFTMLRACRARRTVYVLRERGPLWSSRPALPIIRCSPPPRMWRL